MAAPRARFSSLLAASAMGVYLLVVAGATGAVADAARACPTWPGCTGPVLGDVALAVAWGHRLLAVGVGLLVLATGVAAWRADADRRVLAPVVVALTLFPLQVAVGAFVVTTGATALVSGLHLATGLVIFGSLVVGLAWHLEARTGSADDDVVRPGSPPVAEAPDHAAEGDPPTAGQSASPGPLAVVRAYVTLTKPRLMWLLCLVAAAGMALAAGPRLATDTVLYTLGGGVLAIGASGTFNNVIERDVDRRMARTADRPVATHTVPVRNAVAFGLILAVLAVGLFLQVSALAAGLGAVAILFYSVVYTVVLKPNTVQNTVIGGFAGSLPALIGWAAVTGSIELPGLALAGVIFLWTPAHFYNLAMAYKDDYARGGFPMMPVVRGDTETRKHIVYYLGATLVAAGAMASLADLGVLYAATTAVFGAVFLAAVLALHREQTDRAAMRSFHASNAYLGAVLVAVVVDAIAV